MRIAGYIEHPRLKITIFEMENRFSVKFENPLFEQTYKFRKGEHLHQVSDIQSLVDKAFIRSVEVQMEQLAKIRSAALERIAPNPEDEFDVII